MKKYSSDRSAFFNPRALLGFALCFLGVAVAVLALSGLTGRSVEAQSARATTVKFQAAPTNLKPVVAVSTRPLREQPLISPSLAPGKHHPEPMRPAAPTKGAGVDTARQAFYGKVYATAVAVAAPTSTGVNFTGVGVGLGNFTPGGNPPDVNGRVGATQYVQWNNTSFAIFNKTNGALLYGPAAGNTLFQALGGVCATHNDGDPVVSYDILAGRWVISQFVVFAPAGTFSHQCIAVSQTGDALGAYYLYDFLSDGTNFVDYPHTGVWPDGYYNATHVFNSTGTAYVAGRVYVYERAAMIAGLPARQQSVDLAPSGGQQQYGFLVADLDSAMPPPPGEAEYVLGPDPTNLGLVTSARIAVTWGATPSITSTQTTIATTPFADAFCANYNPAVNGSGRQCVPQPPPAVATDDLDNLSDHFMYRLAYRNNGTQAAPQESLLANVTIAGAPATHDAIRWYEFRNAGDSTAAPTVFQQSTYDPDTSYRWMGSIAMDKDQDIALGYSKADVATFPSIWITGRLGSDAINTMGSETLVQAGLGSQQGGGNRWGDYTSMTLDPVDQCTFYYTDEYLKTNGAFNWSTRVASYRFPSCVSAPAWGTVSGTITSSETGAPISGVLVTLNNGFAGASDASGNYTILAPPGSYTATATDAARNCASAFPVNPGVSVSSSGTTAQDFAMTGSSKLEASSIAIDDSTTGNNNGIVNKAECIKVNATIKNNGCAREAATSATLTTSTAGVTVVDGNSAYPDTLIDGTATNATPFRISTFSTFVCGTNIALSLNLNYASGTKTVAFSVPTCAGGANQTIPASTVSPSDSPMSDRLGRNQVPSTCAGKAYPNTIGTAGTRNYKTFNFTNDGGAPACFTVNMTSAGSGGQIIAVAYLNSFDPANQGVGYLGDSGISNFGSTVKTASFAFNVPALSNFVIVVETASAGATSTTFSGTVSGFYNQISGPGPCPAAPTAPNLAAAASRLGGLDTPIALSGPQVGVEDRNGNGNYSLVLTFDSPLQSGSANVTSGTGTAGTPTLVNNIMTVPLSGVLDQRVITVTTTNVTGTNGGVLTSTSVNIGFLVGDTNNDGYIDASDIGLVQSKSGSSLH